MNVRNASTAEMVSMISFAAPNDAENGTTSSAWMNSLNGTVPRRVDGAWIP